MLILAVPCHFLTRVCVAQGNTGGGLAVATGEGAVAAEAVVARGGIATGVTATDEAGAGIVIAAQDATETVAAGAETGSVTSCRLLHLLLAS